MKREAQKQSPHGDNPAVLSRRAKAQGATGRSLIFVSPFDETRAIQKVGVVVSGGRA